MVGMCLASAIGVATMALSPMAEAHDEEGTGVDQRAERLFDGMGGPVGQPLSVLVGGIRRPNRYDRRLWRHRSVGPCSVAN